MSPVETKAARQKVVDLVTILSKVDAVNELTSQVVGDLVDLSRLEHNVNLGWDELGDARFEVHLYPIILLAWIKIALSRASRYAKEARRSGGGFSSDGTERASRNVDMVATLRSQYDTYVEEHGLDRGIDEGIIAGTLVKRSLLTGRTHPEDLQPGPPPMFISGAIDSGDVVLAWDLPWLSDFQRYRIYRSSVSGLKDETTIAVSGNEHPGVRSDATHVTNLDHLYYPAYRLSGLSAGAYYMVVVLQDINDRVSVSNEVQVTVT